MIHRRSGMFSFVIGAFVVVALAACGSSGTTGGAAGDGGASGAGGTALGGNSAGATGSGGSAQVNSGGSTGRGGASGLGGAAGGGGAPASGGATGTGGTPATGGSTGAGGMRATGGTSGAGGTPATGGAPGAGGMPASGGAMGTGGAVVNMGAFPAASKLVPTDAEFADANMTIYQSSNFYVGPFPEASYSDGAGAPTVASGITFAPTGNDFHNSATFTVSVVGADAGGEAALTYVWESTGDTPQFSFSPNNSNAAKTTSITTNSSGDFSFRVTIRNAAGKVVTKGVVMHVLLSS